MKLNYLFAALVLLAGVSVNAQTIPGLSAEEQAEMARYSCTSIMVGKNASTDGSVITSHTCDSWYRTWMTMTPAADHKAGSKEAIYDGRMHTQAPSDSTGMRITGYIPQVAHTYRYLDTSYPCMNEKQLAMGETTISGRRELQNRNGMFMIEELQRVALERCSTAREAISLMGQLVKEYGYRDSGECLTIADPKEVWIFEIFGEGKDKIGGVWAAVRIPDDHIAVSANISRISSLDLKNKDRFMASDNVYVVALELGLWDGEEKFSFCKAYGGNAKNYSPRELFIFNTLAPSAGFKDGDDLPLTVKPDSKVSAQDVITLLSSYYEGTENDPTRDLMVEMPRPRGAAADTPARKVPAVAANPWLRPDGINLYKAAGDQTNRGTRTISEPWCAYSTVIQCRSWLPNEIGGLAWVSLDNPGESPRFPIYCGVTQLPAPLSICGGHYERDDSAVWMFRKANRLATVKWGTFRQQIEAARAHFIQKALVELPFVEQTYVNTAKGLTAAPFGVSVSVAGARSQAAATDKGGTNAATDYLNGYVADFFGAETAAWKDMERYFWQQTWSGF